jgi:amino acid adenylation domain-containing protein
MVSASIQERFAGQVGRTPDAMAVSSAGIRWTYQELDERANRIAHRLVRLGVHPDTPVAVLMDRSADLVAATLGVIKAGACYLPLHTAYPPERMQAIMDRCGRPVLLADAATRDRGLPRTGQVVVVDVDSELAALPGSAPAGTIHPDQLAYVIHTSGSTGQPKGVAVSHRNVLGLVDDPCWDGGAHARVLMVAPYAFNVSTYELWVPLLRGGEIVVAPTGDLDVETLRRLIVEEKITGLHLTAGLFRVMAEEAPGCFAGVREVLTGGDVIAPLAIQRVLQACPDLVVRAMYGATEVTVFSNHEPLTAPYEAAGSVPVGGPMDQVRTYILDERLSPVPAGTVGEVYLAGRGVARGYFGRADLTAERFVADPFAGGGQRMYRTGDLASQTSDGRMVFTGRASDQVKIRGFRVSLGEVEAVLANHPGLAHVAVVAKESEAGGQRLAAYVVPEPDGFDLAALRAHANQQLPDYMVPTAFVPLDTLPLTPNGKLDRKALPEPDLTSGSAYVAPRNAAQETMCAIFAEVLGVPQVGIDDSFFELGGQSLLAMRLISRIRSALDVDLSIAEFFDAPTVAGLDDHLSNRKKKAS